MNGAVPPIGLNGAVPPIGLNGAGPLGAGPLGAGPLGAGPLGAGPAGTLVAKTNEIARVALELPSINAPASIANVNAAFAASALVGVIVTLDEETTTVGEPASAAKVIVDPPVCAIVIFLPVTAEIPSENINSIGRGALPALFNTAKVVMPFGGSELSRIGAVVSTPVVNLYEAPLIPA